MAFASWRISLLICFCLMDGTDAFVASSPVDEPLQAQLDTLKNLVYELKTKVKTLEDDIKKQDTQRCAVRESAAFMAQLSANLVNPAAGDVIIFDDVETNEGDVYDNTRGIFTAPLNGTYNFNLISSASMNERHHSLHLHIMKNYVQYTGFIFLDWNEHFWLRHSTDITVRLEKGDTMHVKVSGVVGNNILGGCCFHTHFSGFLIAAD